MVKLGIDLHILRDLSDGNVLTLFVIVDISLHLEQIDNTFKFIFCADWQLKTDCVFAKSGSDLFNGTVEVRTHDIHLIDKCHTWYIVGIRLTPYVLRLRLNSTLCTEHAYGAIQYTKGTLNLYCKVNVAWSINNIDTVFLGTRLYLAVFLLGPVAGCSS